MHARRYFYDEKDTTGRGCNDSERANETSGLQGRVKIMAMPCKKDHALYSPTSALKEKANAEPPGREESVLSDSDSDNLAFIVRHWEFAITL